VGYRLSEEQWIIEKVLTKDGDDFIICSIRIREAEVVYIQESRGW